MGISLTLAKSVQIQNFRLNLVYQFLYAVVFIYSVYSFINERKYSESIPNDPDLTIVFGGDSQSNVFTNYSFPVCNMTEWEFKPQDFESQNWFDTWANRDCASICGLTGGDGCTEIGEIATTDSVYQLRMTTSMVDVFRGQNLSLPAELGGGPTNGTLSWAIHHMYPSALLADIEFIYRFRLQRTPSEVPLLFGLNDGMPRYASNKNVRTAVLTANRDIANIYEPGEKITLRADKIMVLTDWSVFADEHTATNYDPGVYVGTDYVKIPLWFYDSGGTFQSHVECYNDNLDVAKRANSFGKTWDIDATWSDPVCFLFFTLISDQSFTYHIDYIPGGAEFHTRYEYVLMTTKGHSYCRSWDLASILLNITSTIVLLSIPTKLIRIFIMHCLGQLSTIYKRVVVQPFDVRKQCGTTAVKLMANSVPFVKLSDVATEDGHQAISRRRMKERLTAALKHRGSDLDENEVDILSNFCFKEVVIERQRQGGMQCECCVMGDKEVKKQPQAGPSDVIDIDGFSNMLSKNEALDFDNIVKLFDRDRRVNIGERIFTPPDLWRYVRNPTSDPDMCIAFDDSEKHVTIEEHWSRMASEVEKNTEARQKIDAFEERDDKLCREVAALKEHQTSMEKHIADLQKQVNGMSVARDVALQAVAEAVDPNVSPIVSKDMQEQIGNAVEPHIKPIVLQEIQEQIHSLEASVGAMQRSLNDAAQRMTADMQMERMEILCSKVDALEAHFVGSGHEGMNGSDRGNVSEAKEEKLPSNTSPRWQLEDNAHNSVQADLLQRVSEMERSVATLEKAVGERPVMRGALVPASRTPSHSPTPRDPRDTCADSWPSCISRHRSPVQKSTRFNTPGDAQV